MAERSAGGRTSGDRSGGAAARAPAETPAPRLAPPAPGAQPAPEAPPTAAARAPLEDWTGIQEKLALGDRLAFLRVARLVSAVLAQLRAHDFRDEWDDLRQEVMAAVFASARRGRLRDPQAFVAYVRIITRNKFVDRLKQRARRHERDTQPWEEETARALALAAAAPPVQDGELWAEVARLPPPGPELIEGIYREGRTYEEMAQHAGMPLGTLKRRLREALASLRGRLEDLRGEPRSGTAGAADLELG
jgi:RNA polymerase sigma-70 factor (ECF subfamily)